MPDDKDPTPPQKSVVDAMKGVGLDPAGPKKATLPADRVFELFQQALAEGLSGASKPKATPGAEGATSEPRAPSDFEILVQGRAREAFDEYVRTHIAKDQPEGAELAVDGAMLRDHAGPMVTAVLQSLAQSFVPQEIKLEVPKKKAPGEYPQGASTTVNVPPANSDAPAQPGEAAADPQVKLKVDFNRLIGDFIGGLRPREPEADEDDEEPS